MTEASSGEIYGESEYVESPENSLTSLANMQELGSRILELQ